MKAVEIRAIVTKEGNGYSIKPATKADERNLDAYISSNDKKYVTVTAKTVSNKTYEQVKTAWALMNILFIYLNHRKPTEEELEQFYQELLERYGEERDSLLEHGKKFKVSISKMDKRQMSMFIQNLVTLIGAGIGLSDADMIDVKELYQEWQMYLSSLKEDWLDFDEHGNMIPIPEWKKYHTVSFATGAGGNLDVAHIVSKGSDEIHRDCCWNVMMLTREEHQLQHQIGWDEFLKIYPHLRGRVNRAREIAHKIEILEDF